MMNRIMNNDAKEWKTKKVYYFSGTGNSYYVAKTISDALNAELCPIVSIKEGDTIEGDLLGFVFPVYESKPPKIVTDTLKNSAGIKARRIFGIATYGVALSSALKRFEKTLSEKGGSLSLGYGIKSPVAMKPLGYTEEESTKLLSQAEEKITRILEEIGSSTTGKIERTWILENGAILRQLPTIVKLMRILLFQGSKSLEFQATEDCIKCRLCERICPVGNIVWDKNAPVFGDRCTSCFGCIQWCPASAIQFGIYGLNDLGIRNYHHPKVEAEDLIKGQSPRKEEM